ncbi:MAG: hypothetical protein ABGY71_13425 [bacterium]|jgi:hypothetical protein|nr:hypothetical protein [Planctomycetota bacterium]HIL53056.1 hypothetical protein [Planctomycetota bacterium]
MKPLTLLLAILVFVGLTCLALFFGPLAPDSGDNGVDPAHANGSSGTVAATSEPRAQTPEAADSTAAEEAGLHGTLPDPESAAASELLKNHAPRTSASSDSELARSRFRQAQAGLSLAELQALRDELARLIEKARRAGFEERFSHNNFDVVYPEDPPAAPPPLGPGNRSILTEFRTHVDPDTQQVAAWVATLPFDEYPELYGRLDELDWLEEMIGK